MPSHKIPYNLRALSFSSLLFAACDENSLKSIIKPIYASASSKALLKTSTRLSLNSHASSTTSFPFFPPPFLKPPRPSCRTSAACPSWSKAMVRVVGNNGVSNDVGSGRRCVLFFCDIIYWMQRRLPQSEHDERRQECVIEQKCRIQLLELDDFKVTSRFSWGNAPFKNSKRTRQRHPPQLQRVPLRPRTNRPLSVIVIYRFR